MGALGDTLRERRSSLGYTLDQAEAATRIRARLLEALENGEYDRLPAPGYVRGYVSSYARFLELEPLPLLALYKAESGGADSQDLNFPQAGEAVVPRHEQHALPWRAGVAVIVAVALVSLSVWVVGRLWSGPEAAPPEPTVPVQPTETVEATKNAVAEPVTPEPSAELPFTVEVRVSDTGASWLRISIDGRKAYEGTLTGGQSKKFEAASLASIRIGKPSEVTVLRDGARVKIPDGDTPTVTLKASATR